MKLLTLVAGGLVLLSSVNSGADDKFATIKESPLKPIKGKGKGNETNFSGAVEISGQFIVVWWNDEDDLIRIKMIPDEKSRSVLPFLVEGFPVSSNRPVEPVTEIEFDGSRSNVRKLLPPEKARAFLSKRIREATGTATLRIKSYMSGVDCDHRWYHASIASVILRKPETLTAGNNATFRC